MTTEQILSEIKNIDVDSFEIGMSILQHFNKVGQQYPAESLLLHFPNNNVKWYYNYTEKLLRRIEVNFKQVHIQDEKEHSLNDHWFTAISDEDESSIPFTASQFADKIVVYNDWHKLVTYDESTGHYECFFVDISKDIANDIIKNQMLSADEVLNNPDTFTIEEILEESEDFATACSVLSNWMLNNNVVSELRFIHTQEGIKLDLIQSMLFTGSQKDVPDDLGKPDSL